MRIWKAELGECAVDLRCTNRANRLAEEVAFDDAVVYEGTRVDLDPFEAGRDLRHGNTVGMRSLPALSQAAGCHGVRCTRGGTCSTLGRLISRLLALHLTALRSN